MPTLYSAPAASARRLLLPTALLALAVAPLAGCDSEGPVEDDVTIRGQVTTEASSSGVGPSAPVESATVTAFRVSSSGDLDQLDGQATTDATGAFTLDTEGTSDAVVLRATAATPAGFSSQVLLEPGAAESGTITAPPMTAETDAEVDVYLELRGDDSDATAAEVAFFVTSDVAARIASGATTAADVAAALDAAVRAEAAYADEVGEADEVQDARDRRVAAYATLRASLSAATTGEARRAAYRAFEEAFAAAFAGAGATAEVQAGAALAAARAAARFGGDLGADAGFAVERQARLAVALAAAQAVEARFTARGASTTALEAARVMLVAALRDAENAAALAAAEAAYRAAVSAQLVAEGGVTADEAAAALAATAAARATLEASVSAATTAEAVAEAVATYRAQARDALVAALGQSNEFAVDVLLAMTLSLVADPV